MLSADWTVFVDFYPRFLQVYRRLAKTTWFQQRQWAGFVGHFTHGIFLQLSKPSWYNYELDGIHFELAIDKSAAEKKLANCGRAYLATQRHLQKEPYENHRHPHHPL